MPGSRTTRPEILKENDITLYLEMGSNKFNSNMDTTLLSHCTSERWIIIVSEQMPFGISVAHDDKKSSCDKSDWCSYEGIRSKIFPSKF